MRLALLLVLVLLASDADAKQRRSTAAKHRFVKEAPCPATGRASVHCPGYVIDHIEPLCAGGPDRASNMQWQTVSDAKAKDALERRQCAAMRRGAAAPR